MPFAFRTAVAGAAHAIALLGVDRAKSLAGDGIVLICHFENSELEADPGVGWKLPTIGWGHTAASALRAE